MDINDIVSKDTSGRLLIYNPEYYSFIFKKTEKVVCAVFYITEGKKDTHLNKDVVLSVQHAAQHALDTVLDALTDTGVGHTPGIQDAHKALLRLESVLQVALSAGVMHADYTDILSREIRDVIRNLHALRGVDERTAPLMQSEDRVYTEAVRSERLRASGGTAPRARTAVVGESAVRQQRETRPKAEAPKREHAGRREAIIALLRSKGQAGIKDISDVITDCSEKTIQRELADMVARGVVVREGERRWSIYKLTNTQ